MVFNITVVNSRNYLQWWSELAVELFNWSCWPSSALINEALCFYSSWVINLYAFQFPALAGLHLTNRSRKFQQGHDIIKCMLLTLVESWYSNRWIVNCLHIFQSHSIGVSFCNLEIRGKQLLFKSYKITH